MSLLQASRRSAKKKEEQCLRIHFKEDPLSLDPRRVRNMSGASQLQAMLFEGLMRLEPDGSLSCAQALSYTISPDNKVYTFHLRDTWWSDGSPVTAKDFETTWKDILNPSFPSKDAHILFCVKNALLAKKGSVPLQEVGIYAKDEKTLVVELEYPSKHFLYLTASTVLFPISHVQEKVFSRWYMEASDKFICNGPFKLISWRHHEEIKLEKNPLFRNAHKIALDSIHIHIMNNGIATLHRYVSGLADVIWVPLSPLPFDIYRELIQQNLLHIVETPGTVVCMFNTKQFPFHNVNIRKAFSYAIHRQKLIDTTTLLKERPALGAIAPMLRKNTAKTFYKDNDLKQARLHLQKGLKELDIGLEDLNGKISFSFWRNDHGCPVFPQALQEQWFKKLGVKVELEALDFHALHDKGKKGLFSMGYYVYNSMHCADALEVLERFKYANDSRNYARWENPSYIRLLEQASRCQEQDTRFGLLEEAERILIDDMPFAPIFHWNIAFLIQPYVKGFAMSPLGTLYLESISLEKNSNEETFF